MNTSTCFAPEEVLHPYCSTPHLSINTINTIPTDDMRYWVVC